MWYIISVIAVLLFFTSAGLKLLARGTIIVIRLASALIAFCLIAGTLCSGQFYRDYGWTPLRIVMGKSAEAQFMKPSMDYLKSIGKHNKK